MKEFTHVYSMTVTFINDLLTYYIGLVTSAIFRERDKRKIRII